MSNATTLCQIRLNDPCQSILSINAMDDMRQIRQICRTFLKFCRLQAVSDTHRSLRQKETATPARRNNESGAHHVHLHSHSRTARP